jgi:hypothetical protein
VHIQAPGASGCFDRSRFEDRDHVPVKNRPRGTRIVTSIVTSFAYIVTGVCVGYPLRRGHDDGRGGRGAPSRRNRPYAIQQQVHVSQMFPKPCRMFSQPCRMFPKPCRMFPQPCRMFPKPCRVFPEPCRLFPKPCRMFPKPCRMFPLPQRTQQATTRYHTNTAPCSFFFKSTFSFIGFDGR